MKNKLILGALALLFLTCTWALAGAVEDRYLPVRNKTNGVAQTTALASHRSIVDGSEDSKTTLTPYDLQPTGGDTLVVVAPRFTVEGASCQVEVWLYQTINGTSTLMGIAAVQTCSAGDGTMARQAGSGGDYLPSTGPLYFDAAGADSYDPRFPVISSGTVKSWAWTLGGNGKAAE